MNKLLPVFVKTTIGIIVAATVISCNQTSQKPTKSNSDTSVHIGGERADNIAYINADTLSEKYQYFKDVQAKLEEKIKKAQSDLQSKGQAFQREIAEYQEKAGTMSASERQSTEERLARKQDELGRLDQNASASIAQDEATEFNNVYTSITEYLRKHAEENGYTLVLTYSNTNPTVLYIDPSLEITKEVIEALNKDYNTKKEKK